MVWLFIVLLVLFNVALPLWRFWVTRKNKVDYDPY